MTIKTVTAVIAITMLGLLAGCSPTSPGDGGITGTGIVIDGSAQKGPYVAGSRIDISRLDEKGVAIEGSLTTETINALGDFTFAMDEPGVVQIKADGYFFNELTKSVTSKKLTLNAIALVNEASGTNTQTINVNILTHLTAIRIKTLMAQGVAMTEAAEQAQQEWLTAFEPLASVDTVEAFNRLRLYQDKDATSEQIASNNYLLFISAVFYQYALDRNSEVSLSVALNNIAEDFGNNGQLDQYPNLIAALQVSMQKLDAEVIKTNLKEWNTDNLDEFLTEVFTPADPSDYLAQMHLIISSPAEGSMITTSVAEVRPLGMQRTPGIAYYLLIDGIKAGQLGEGQANFTWLPYFWSADNNPHSLIIEGRLGDKSIYSDTVNIRVSGDLRDDIILTYPVNAEIVKNNATPLLTWQPMAGAVHYKVKVFSTDNPATPVYETMTTTTEVKVPPLLKGQYNWQLQAGDEMDRFGAWSNQQTFSIDGPAATEADSMETTVVRGDDNAYGINMAWAAVEGAESYILEIAKDEDFADIVTTYQTTDTHQDYEAALGKYYWRVRAVNTEGVMGNQSDVKAANAGVYIKTFDAGSAKHLVATKDNGVLILASTKQDDWWGDDWIIKLDVHGNLEWDYILKKEGRPLLSTLREFSDGFIYAIGNHDVDAYIIKLSGDTLPANRIQWETQYRKSGFDRERFNSLVELNNTLYLTGYEQTRITSSDQTWYRFETTYKIYEFDTTTSNLIKSMYIPDPDGIEITGVGSLSITKNENFLIACSAMPANYDAEDYGAGCILNLTTDGMLNWSWNSTHPYMFSGGYYAAEIQGEGFLLAGQREAGSWGSSPLAILNKSGKLQTIYTLENNYSHSVKSIFDNDNNILRIYSRSDQTSSELVSTSQKGIQKVLKIFNQFTNNNISSELIEKSADGGILLLFDYSSDQGFTIIKTDMKGNY